MLFTLLIWIYISWLSYCWGELLIRYTIPKLEFENKKSPESVIICFIGLIPIAGLACAFSFLIPLGQGLTQLIFAVPAFLQFRSKHRHPFKIWTRWQLFNAVLFLLSVTIVLITSTYKISHPDSLGYHFQIVNWIRDLKATPGIANLNSRLGFQSNWFVLCALFNFNFITQSSYVYLNALATVWALYLIISKISRSINEKRNKDAFLWLLLLTATLSSYTQIFLTATSISPDFIATIYIWLTLFFLYQGFKTNEALPLIFVIFFSFFAFTIKLSAAPIVICGLYAFLQLLNRQTLSRSILPIILIAILSTGFFARNALSSGYIFYPSSFPDILNVDWKLPIKKVQREKKYVASFAKTESGASNEEIDFSNNMRLLDWLPIWWKHRSVADQIILAALALSLFISLYKLKKIIKKTVEIRIAFLTCLTGVAFWFSLGPDPRFAFGFIIGFIGLTFYSLVPEQFFTLRQRVIFLWICLLGGSEFIYTTYRLKKFFVSSQLIYPMGPLDIPASTQICDSILIRQSPVCGSNPIPCVEQDCSNFSARGNSLTDGFKPKAHD